MKLTKTIRVIGYPDDIEKISKDLVVIKNSKKRVTVGPSESMSKSKKNTVDQKQ